MILRLKVDEVCDVSRSRTLSVARVMQASARRADRFIFPAKPVTIESSHLEMIEQERCAVFFLPLPIIKRSQRCRKAVLSRREIRLRRLLTLQWERRRLNFS